MSGKERDIDFIDSVQNKAIQKALCRLLAKLELIPYQNLDSTISFKDCRPISYFANLGFYKEEDCLERVAKELRIPVHSFTKELKESSLKLTHSPQFKKIDTSFWKRICAVPVSLANNMLVLAMANPLDMESIKQLEFDLHLKIQSVLAKEQEIFDVFETQAVLKDGLDFSTLLQSNNNPELKPIASEMTSLESNIATEDISAPTVIRIVNKIFAGAIQRMASDVHISPEQENLIVRLRVDGIMRHFIDIPESYKNAVIARIKVLCGMDITEKRNPQDGRLRLKTSLGTRDLRISTVPTVYGENIVARILSSEITNLNFDSLGLPTDIVDSFEKAVRASSKVCLVAGPTGSGKTSTLYAALLSLRDGTSHIVTIEDPIEYRMQGINQIQVNHKNGVNFASALRSILRQDPDVIMLGEIRDSDTASVAMQVAQTGHFVISTIHTNSAAAAITRLRDLDVPSFLVASSLGSVLAQRLVRRLCEACKKPASEEVVERLVSLKIDPTNVMRPCGCEHCDKTGYKGRIGVYSFLNINQAVASAIREERSEPEIESIARKFGYQSLEEAALKIANDGITSIEEIERVIGPLESRYAMELHDIVAMSPASSVSSPSLTYDKIDSAILEKRKVLVVDDDEDIRAIYKMILEYEMYDVIQAEDGFDALNKIYESTPEIILLDLMMPKMGGLEMIEKLRSNPRTRNLPVLVLTAADKEENELELIKRGADDFISKTAKSEIIIARINRLLNR